MMEQPTTWIGLIAFIIGVLVTPYVTNRMKYKRLEDKDENAKVIKELTEQRVINDEDMSKLNNHHLFMQIAEIISGIPSIYNKSKKGRGQEVYSLLYYYILKIYETSCREQVDRIDKNRTAPKDHVTRLVKQSIIVTDENARIELINRGIPMHVVDIFLQWYRDNYEWYLVHLNTVLNNKDSYYNQIDQVLWGSSAFVCALNVGFKQKIDTFNGSVEKELTDEIMLNLDYGKSFLNPKLY